MISVLHLTVDIPLLRRGRRLIKTTPEQRHQVMMCSYKRIMQFWADTLQAG